MILASEQSTRRVLVMLLGAASVTPLWVVEGDRALMAVAPWLIFTGWYTFMRDQSLVSLKAGLKPLFTAIHAGWLAVFSVIAGRRTSMLIAGEQYGHDPDQSA